MAKQNVLIEVDVPDGWEATGEFRAPVVGEFHAQHGKAISVNINFATPRIILRRVKQYREPVLPADYGKQCEFSDDEVNWHTYNLHGFWHAIPGEPICWRGGFSWYKYCRIEKEST